MNATAAPAGHRIAPLDGLRAVAVLLVIPHNGELPWGEIGPLEWLLRHFYALGWMGVQLFFVLSGYLITRILRQTRGQPGYFRTFYLRRAFRILPAYFLLLLIGLAVVPRLIEMPPEFTLSPAAVASVMFFYSNWVAPFGIAIYGLGHLWSLAVEEQFYLVWPAVIRGLDRRQLMQWMVIVMLIVPVIRVAMLVHGEDGAEIYQFTVARMDALLAGAWVALAMEDDALRARLHSLIPAMGWGVMAMALVLVVPTHGFEHYNPVMQAIGFSALAVACAWWLAFVLLEPESPRQSWLCWRPLRSIGFHSYGMYLIHQPLNQWWGQRAFTSAWGEGAGGIGASVAYSVLLVAVSYAAAVVLYQAVERPVLRWRDRWAP